MALTCSVLGHAYGDPTVERDREERGSEVVVTIREYETCSRCGTTRVVSENKEVTAVEAEAEEDATVESGPPGEAPDVTGSPPDPVETDPSPDAVEPAEVGTEDPTDDGAEIMDAEAAAPIDEELASPSVAESDDEADSPPESADDDGVVLDEGGPGDGRGPGEWPEEDVGEDEPEWTPADDIDDSGPDVEHSPGRTITVPEGEFRCEECGYTTAVEASSLRAGDFCPECHRGTLEHVRAEE